MEAVPRLPSDCCFVEAWLLLSCLPDRPPSITHRPPTSITLVKPPIGHCPLRAITHDPPYIILRLPPARSHPSSTSLSLPKDHHSPSVRTPFSCIPVTLLPPSSFHPPPHYSFYPSLTPIPTTILKLPFTQRPCLFHPASFIQYPSLNTRHL